VTALAGVLVFSGLLLASMAPIAARRMRRSRRWSEAVGALRLSKVAALSRDESLTAVRGTVEADAPIEDPVTGEEVVWYEVEVRVAEDTTDVIRGETSFVLRDESGTAWVDPKGARDVAVRIDQFEPGHDRTRVAAFFKKRGLSNRADVSLVHRHIPVGADLVVVGRSKADERAPRDDGDGSYREGQERVASFTAGDDAQLVLTTHSLEAFRERELASTKSGTAGVIMLAVMGLGCTAAGAAIFVLGV